MPLRGHTPQPPEKPQTQGNTELDAEIVSGFTWN